MYLLKKYLHVDILTEVEVVYSEHLSSACDLILKALTRLPILCQACLLNLKYLSNLSVT